MDIHQLQLLVAVVESPTMTKAAEKMHLSTAAVSVQVQALAQELKTELFVRSGRKLLVTPAGRRVADEARNIIALLDSLKHEFPASPQHDTRPFHFATGATTLIYRLGKPFRRLRQEFPNLDLHVSVLATEEMIAGMLERKFDLALISLPVSEEKLRLVPLFEEELLLVRPSPTRIRGHHIGNVRRQEIDGAPFLLYPPQSNMRKVIDRFFDDLEVRRRVVMEASDTEAIKGLVESGFGYSILPEYALKEQTKFFQTMRIEGRRLLRRQALAMPKSSQPRALTEAVSEFLRKAFENQSASSALGARVRSSTPKD
jgi:DNA-binding transcriptional LysR family regulator